MEIQPEVGAPHHSTTTTPSEIGGETVVISKAELEDLQYRAGASSQNFERLKKANEEIQDLTQRITALEAEPDPSGKNDEELGKLKTKVAELSASQVKSEVLEKYPQLKEVWSDFEKFHAEDDNKGMALRTAAKAFLTEKGLLDPQRKPLERPTGGDRTPPSPGMSAEDAKNLRETNYKEYRRLVKIGAIQVS